MGRGDGFGKFVVGFVLGMVAALTRGWWWPKLQPIVHRLVEEFLKGGAIK